MRISDWSSDVCSSDLGRFSRRYRRYCATPGRRPEQGPDLGERFLRRDARAQVCSLRPGSYQDYPRAEYFGIGQPQTRSSPSAASLADWLVRERLVFCPISMKCRYRRREASRSEEHTSELQSLMRISYAVFCLKKK